MARRSPGRFLERTVSGCFRLEAASPTTSLSTDGQLLRADQIGRRTGQGFYVSSSSPRGATLLYIDLKGKVSALWEQKGSWQTWGIPSPDGRHLAILGFTID